MKLCKSCNCEKPETDFHKDGSKADGLNAYCKPCQIARQKAYAMRPPRHQAPEGMKRCQTCKETKPLDEFFASNRTFDSKDKICKTCRKVRHEEWRLANLDKAAANGRKWRKNNPRRSRDHGLKNAYGIPLGTYDKMLADQNGGCAICKTDKPGGRGDFHVDHCHDQGDVRGLLCHNCNVGLGHFQHRTDLLQSAINYVEVFNRTSQKTR